MDWYRNSREQWLLGAEDDASQKDLGMIEIDARSAERSVKLLDEVRRDYAPTGEILEVITDDGSEFYAPNRDVEGEASHPLEEYLDEHGIQQTLCAVGRPQSKGRLSGFSRPTTSSAGGSSPLGEFLDSTTMTDRT